MGVETMQTKSENWLFFCPADRRAAPRRAPKALRSPGRSPKARRRQLAAQTGRLSFPYFINPILGPASAR